jgi:serine/threonine-protein kinase
MDALLAKGFLENDAAWRALATVGRLLSLCPSCQYQTAVADYQPGQTLRCPRCQTELGLAELKAQAKRDPTQHLTLESVESPETPVEEPSAPPPPPESEPEADDPILFKVIGGCQIIRRIAKGGMGVVYQAKQLKLGRPVAVKVLSEELAKDRNFVHRFLQEARSAAELNHGNIVHIIDVGEINGLFYIIMEYVDGSNLREILDAHEKLDPERALEIALQASQALRHAHQRGVIHRDIKPENIMIACDGMVKIADLGLAKKVAPGEQDGGITSAGAILGTPYYMAPEQVKDFSKVDGRSDIYSLGVSLFRALTGGVPFKGRTPVEVMIRVVEGKRASIHSLNPAVPEAVEQLVDRMMHRFPEKRFQDFAEVIQEMEAVLYDLRSQRRLPSGSGS